LSKTTLDKKCSLCTMLIKMKSTKEKPKSKNLIVKSNELIQGRYELKISQIKLILHMITLIRKDDEDFKEYKISIKDYAQRVGIDPEGEYSHAKEITEDLLKKVMKIAYEDEGGKERFLQINWLSHADYAEGEGYVEISFDPKLKPYLLALKERFTQYDIRNVLPLKSFYSIRIYELLKQFEQVRYRVFKIKELKEMLGLEDKYKSYSLFKKRVIEKAQEELKEHSDLYFDFEEIKQHGRAYTHVKFNIHTQESPTVIEIEREALSEKTDKEIELQRLEEEYAKYKEKRIEDFVSNNQIRTKEDFMTEFELEEFKDNKALYEMYKEKGIESVMFKALFNRFIEKKFMEAPKSFEGFSEEKGYEIKKDEKDKYHIERKRKLLLE